MYSVAKNYFYSALFQIYSILAGLLTAPYLSRVLGPQGLGVSTYVNTVLNYFILFGTLSSDYFASREFIYSQKDKRVFWDLWLMRVICLGLSMTAYLTMVFFSSNYKLYFMILFAALASQIFNVTWFYYAVEDFRTLSLRNFVVRTASLLPVFFLVKTPQDLWKFLATSSVTTLTANLVLFGKAAKENLPVKLSFLASVNFLPGAVKMFLPELSINIYSHLDKLMIEWFAGASEVGYYEVASKFPIIALSLITSMTPIMMARMSHTLAEQGKEWFENYVRRSLKFSIYLSSVFLLTLLVTANELVPWFFGAQFAKSVPILYVKVFIIFFVSVGVVAGHQALVALHGERHLTISVVAGAVINSALNFLFIPKFGALGAAVASLIAEGAVTLSLYSFLSRYVRVKLIFSEMKFTFVVLLTEFLFAIVLLQTQLWWFLKGFLFVGIHFSIVFFTDREIRAFFRKSIKSLRIFF